MLKSILSLLLFSSFCFSSDNFKFSFDGDFGYVPKSASQAYICPDNYKYTAYKDVFFLTLSPKVELFKFIQGKFDFTSFSVKVKSNQSFAPFRIVWKNEFGVFHDFDNIRLSISWDHLCGHRAVSSKPGCEKTDLFDNFYDRIYFRFSYKN